MAMYHFRLKSDKKPNGTRVSAVKHVEYIRREGNFAEQEQWQAKTKFVGNVITTAEKTNALDGQTVLLYKTDEFGSIRNTARGIEVSAQASPTTISIALMLAYESLNHQPLILHGSPEFKKSVLSAAVFDELEITFADQLLQNEFVNRKEKAENERRKFIEAGGRVITKRAKPKSSAVPTNVKTVETITKAGFSVPTLSELAVVCAESESTDVLLSADESSELDGVAENLYNNVRWNFANERKRLAKWTAQKILERVEETLDSVNASSHVEYINRERAFEQRGGCIFHTHRLPKWAQDDPKKFFKAADRYEGVGNRRYMEIEFALPNELRTVEQYRQIIDAFIAKHLSEHYYAYAIHNKIGVMSDGQHHPHVHIMFSERLIDEVEKTRERAACNFFKYPLRRNVTATFEERRKHGAPKARKWSDKNFLTILRADFAEIQNEVLAKNGFSIRVDHRTLKAQKAEAERNGDTFLARLFSRIPEKYIGVISCQEDDNPKLERLRKYRALRKQQFELVMKLDELTKGTEALETKDAVQVSLIKAKNLMDAPDYVAQKNLTERQRELRARMFTAVAEVNKWKRVIISYNEAEEQARLEYMSAAERELWQNYLETLAQKKQLEEFLKNLRKPQTTDREAVKAYEEVVAGVKSKIFSLFTASLMMKKSVEEIERRLESAECKKNIVMVTHQILQANVQALKELKRANEELDKAVDELRNAIYEQTVEEPKATFKTREVYDLIRRQFFGLKKEYEKTRALKFELQRRIISPQRALAMAQNIFVGGEFKRLRAAVRQYQKAEQRLARNVDEYTQREKIFQARDWRLESRSKFLQEQYYLTRQRTMLEMEKARLDRLSLSLNSRQTELEKLCQETEARAKIEIIAAGILRKNYKFVRQLEEVEARAKQLAERMSHAKEQMEALKLRLELDKSSTRYKIIIPDNSTNDSAASIIADAILKEPQAVQLVARSTGNNLEMDKTWELMSDLDKDELQRKKIIREL
ncbi:MAG: MobA/MobL family protein [Selenomonadaceae bacterium]|nr:MobA/MobL family protein [Selenomonadaceae bacterium]